MTNYLLTGKTKIAYSIMQMLLLLLTVPPKDHLSSISTLKILIIPQLLAHTINRHIIMTDGKITFISM